MYLLYDKSMHSVLSCGLAVAEEWMKLQEAFLAPVRKMHEISKMKHDDWSVYRDDEAAQM